MLCLRRNRLQRLATFCLVLFLAACNLNAVSEPNLSVTLIPTRTLTLQDVENTEEGSPDRSNPVQLLPIGMNIQ
jgi:hypothetical protein